MPEIDHPLSTVIRDQFGGRIKGGGHDSRCGVACILEASAIARGIDWTDDPTAVGLPDLRPLNDGSWSSDELRTKNMTAVAIALWDWESWSEDRRRRWITSVALRTIREILPIALDAVGLRKEATACRDAETLDAGARAADAAWEAASAAARARAAAREEASAVWEAARARAAASAASSAAAREEASAASSAAASAAWEAARAAARAAEAVLRIACRIWIEAAEEE